MRIAISRRNDRLATRSSRSSVRHLRRRVWAGVVALVALAAAGAGERLLHVLDGQHAERARHAGLELRLLDALARRPRRRSRSGRSRPGSRPRGRPRRHSAPTAAQAFAASGSSNAPGTSWTSTLVLPHPALGERAQRARRSAARRGPRRRWRGRSRSVPVGCGASSRSRSACSTSPATSRDSATLRARSARCSSRNMSSSSGSPWWCSVWPSLSRLARR